MAMVYNVAMLFRQQGPFTGAAMASSRESNRAFVATRDLARLFEACGWRVDVEPRIGPVRVDLVARKELVEYAVEIKATGEGRSDRVIALLSQAILQASSFARKLSMRPLAVVWVDTVSPSLVAKIEQFRQEYAPDVSVGLMSAAGMTRFVGPYLDGMDQLGANGRMDSQPRARLQTDMFSDLNQWMLKVLLAPDVPRHLLNAPQRAYRTGAELADVSGVSLMSVSRLLRRLKEEGFLDDADSTLRIVRKPELFRRWRSSAMRSSPELPVSLVLPAAGMNQLLKVASTLDGCIGLYAAADILDVGHVRGVPPYVYVRKINALNLETSGLLPAAPGEVPSFIIKQANAPESLFRGALPMNNTWVSDVIQIWLDASAHPSRGDEQARHLEAGVLSRLMDSR